MAFVYEVNGQRVEFDREPTDADIDEAARSLPNTTSEPTVEPTGNLAASAAQTAASAGMSIGATGLKELGQAGMAAATPLARAAVAGPVAAYAANPVGMILADAAGLGTVGMPLGTMYQSAASFPEKYQAIKASAGEASKFTSQTPLTTGPTGSQYPGGVVDYRAMGKAVPDAAAQLKAAYDAGGPNAVKAFLATPEAAQYMKNPAFAQAAESYAGKVPGIMEQIGRVAGPVARGAVKALGPVGMGLNMYDAGQMARQTQLGERLAQGQGQQAEQAFRQGPVQSYQGPQLDAQQAQNVMQNASPRDRQYFNDQLNMAIRLKAAKKVLGQP
jgi:hypothetical protein